MKLVDFLTQVMGFEPKCFDMNSYNHGLRRIGEDHESFEVLGLHGNHRWLESASDTGWHIKASPYRLIISYLEQAAKEKSGEEVLRRFCIFDPDLTPGGFSFTLSYDS